MRDLSLNAPDQLSWFADQVALTYEMLMEYNQGRLSPITLTEQNLAFLDRVLALDEVGLNGEEALTFLESVAFDS